MLYLSVWILLLSWTPLQSADSALLAGTFESQRLHVRVRLPIGWRVVSAGTLEDEQIEFWKDAEDGPRIQIISYPFPISDGSDIDKVQTELGEALKRKFPDLRVDQETKLVHQGNPAIEVMATLPANDTYYHVLQRCLFARGRIFIITCASFESSFLSDLPSFRACLDSLEVLGGILDLDSTETGGPLFTARTMGFVGLGFLVMGFFLRRISIARLGRIGH